MANQNAAIQKESASQPIPSTSAQEQAPVEQPSHFLQKLHQTIGNHHAGRWLQAKLKVGSANDEYEQEADRVADQIMRMPNPALEASTASPVVRRKCAECTNEEQDTGPSLVQRKCAKCDEEDRSTPAIQTQTANGPSSGQAQEVDGIHVPQSGGTALPSSLRDFFQPRMGHDLSHVRLHTDAEAANTAQALNALAYTAGHNIVFAAGQYAPENPAGKKLLAHELTHVIQQKSQAPAPITVRRQPQQDPTLTVSGDAQRQSPSGGVPITGGVLTWNLQFRGVNLSVGGSGTAITITQPTDVRMDASFTPSAATAAQCPTISMIQIVKATTGGIPDAPHLLFIRDATSGGAADVSSSGSDTEPFYSAAPSSSGPGLVPDMSSSLAGSATGRSAAATYSDAPFIRWDLIPPGQTAVREFEVAPICIETGQTFGSVKWGFTKTRAGVITLTGAQAGDVQTGTATPDFEQARQAFYSGFFQFSIPNFARGSSRLTRAQELILDQVIASGAARKIVLVGANDASGGPENNANLSLERAQAAQAYLVRHGIAPGIIEVQGHGVEARVATTPGRQEPANRRVDVHIERGTAPLAPGATSPNPVGSAREALRFRHQDPHGTMRELVDLLIQMENMTGRISLAFCTQMTHMLDGLDRQRAIDPTVPDARAIYAPTIRAMFSRCQSMIPRAEFHYEPPPLDPPSFLPRIGGAVEHEPF